MSEKSFKAKLDFILEMIDSIENIIKRHDGIAKSLEDFEGQMAILMGISQIGEVLKKFDDEIVNRIENILRDYLPKLKKKIYIIKKENYGN